MSLEEQSIILFPMPANPCVWVRMRVEFKRERWIKEELKKATPLNDVAQTKP